MKKKKSNKRTYHTNTSSDIEYGKIIKIAIGVILVLFLTYFITALLTGEIDFSKDEETTEEVSIQYEEIMAGEIFNRSSSEYYVMLFNFTDTFASYYLSLKDTYTEEDDHLPMYIVDLEKSFNSKYVLGDDETLIEKPTSLSDFKATNPTIVRIKNGKVVERITGRDAVLEFFD